MKEIFVPKEYQYITRSHLKLQRRNLNTVMYGLETFTTLIRSSHRRCSVKQGALRNFAKFTGKHLCQRLFFHKVFNKASLLKKRLWHRCFPVNFAKFLRAPFLQYTSGPLLLSYVLDLHHYTILEIKDKAFTKN